MRPTTAEMRPTTAEMRHKSRLAELARLEMALGTTVVDGESNFVLPTCLRREVKKSLPCGSIAEKAVAEEAAKDREVLRMPGGRVKSLSRGCDLGAAAHGE